MPAKSLRNPGFDVLRIFAAASVVLLHSTIGPDAAHVSSSLAALRIACRFAVPFFFIAAGYFQRDVTSFEFAIVARPLKRLLPLYIFWTVIYDLVFYAQYGAAALARYNFNAAYHLWFLPALAVGIAVLQAGRAFLGLRFVTLAAVALALLGLASTTYSDMLGFGGLGGRRGWLFALPYLVIGAWLARTKYAPSFKIAVSTIISGYGCSIAEEYLLARSAGRTELFSHDFLFSTFLFGLGVAFLALWLGKNSRSHLMSRLSALGSLSLGIYLSHVLFLWIFSPLISSNSFAGIGLLAMVTLIASALLAFLLAKTPYLRRVAT